MFKIASESRLMALLKRIDDEGGSLMSTFHLMSGRSIPFVADGRGRPTVAWIDAQGRKHQRQVTVSLAQRIASQF